MAHTPEPWQAIPPDEHCLRWIIVQEAPGNASYPMYIGSVYTETLGLKLDAAANAYLFAGAPELLSACEFGSTNILGQGHLLLREAAVHLERLDVPFCDDLAKRLRKKAEYEERAIAKAKGETG